MMSASMVELSLFGVSLDANLCMSSFRAFLNLQLSLDMGTTPLSLKIVCVFLV
jgi:hypothetical protein